MTRSRIVEFEDLPEPAKATALSLLDTEVGSYYRVKLGSPDTWVVAAECEDGLVVGAAVGSLMTSEEREELLTAIDNPSAIVDIDSPQSKQLISALEDGVPAGNLYAIAVSRKSRREGHGRALTEARLRRFSQVGIGLAVAESWVKSTGDSSVPLYESLGFSRLASIDEYWLAGDQLAVDKDPRSCPVCGPTCHCGAVLFASAQKEWQ